MSSKKWVLMFLIFSLIGFGGIALFNVIVDPFGVFGDYFFDWYSYDMTQNPRVAKVGYIDKEHGKYDSYIIGCSSTSSYSVDRLNEYTGDKFYNMIMYGADIYDSVETAKYLINNYEVKNMFLAVYLSNAIQYNYEADGLLGNLHGKIDGSSLLEFYKKYLFLNPNYGVQKIVAKTEDSYLQNKNDVFNVEKGVYDKTKRDIEPIGDIEKYFEVYPVFKNYPYMKIDELSKINECLGSIKVLKEICDGRGINFKVMLTPLYIDYAKYYYQEDIDLFKRELANITDFWDFTLSSVSTEPRYFYDEAHFRNCVGEMALARMYGDDSVYIPSDFGRYITKDNVNSNLVNMFELEFDDSKYVKDVEVLMVNSVRDVLELQKYISRKQSEGYKFVTFDDIKQYVSDNEDIQEKICVLNFSDETLTNIDEVNKVLKSYGIKSNIFLSIDELTTSSYLVKKLQSLSNIKIQLKESEIGYKDETVFIENFRGRIREFNELIGESTGVFWYQNENYDELVEVIINEEGFDISLVGGASKNTLVKGMSQSLRGMTIKNIRF